MSTSRRQAREYALQVLYQVDLSGVTPRQALALFWQNFEPKVDSQEFTNELVEGTWRERERIDKMGGRNFPAVTPLDYSKLT